MSQSAVTANAATAIAGIVIAGVIGPAVAYLFQRRHWRRDRRADAYVEALHQLGERKAWRNPLLNDPDAHPSNHDWRSVEARLRIFGTGTARSAANEALNAHRDYLIAAVRRRSDIKAGTRPISVAPVELSRLADEADEAFDRLCQVVQRELHL